ncbi:hypothetical protein [Streptomyces venetus]|uniref:hypothetical protein n=1 Tax=Streptomyces venetus TaxID=1701086 RepID=UPI003C309A85
MPDLTTRLRADATPTAPAQVLRPWTPADAAALVALGGDESLRRWTSFASTTSRAPRGGCRRSYREG